jgi:PAT family beta-lactamase induction signal transducer AmpG
MRFLAQFLLGISSGLPLLAIGSTLKAWLTESGLSLSTIGFFSIIGLPYTLKFLWAPLFDRYSLPILGRRKGWLIIFQLILAALFGFFSVLDPANDLALLSALSLVIAFFSASQDIIVDAIRRDVLEDKELGLGNGFFVNGYRVGMLLSGALALNLAEHMEWSSVYLIIATSFILGVAGTFLVKESQLGLQNTPTSIKQAILEPFHHFFSKKMAVSLLAFILLYKLGDSMASEMTTPFLLKIGYSKAQIGTIAKTFGLGATMFGALLGGWALYRLGFSKALWIFGLLQATSTLGFAYLSSIPAELTSLTTVIAFENLSSGMGTTAYAAFMASLCDRRFSAAQYALLSSIMGVPRVIFGSSTGYLADILGWGGFFVLCTALAIPAMLLLLRICPWNNPEINK